jgi:alkylhydroperoxidase family enzyme
LQLQGGEAEAIEALSKGDIDGAPIDDAEKALMRFVELNTKHAYKTTAEDVGSLRSAGWSDPQIAEAVYVSALFALFNRVADAFGLLDPGYLQMAAEGESPPIPAEKHRS